jgi:hypothetical protein
LVSEKWISFNELGAVIMAADWKAYPRETQAKALGYQPLIYCWSERAKAEALAYLEARAKAKAKARATTTTAKADPYGMTNKKSNGKSISRRPRVAEAFRRAQIPN